MEKVSNRYWFVSEYYYPVIVSTGYYVTEIAEFLSKKGLNVCVITSNNKYYETDMASSLCRETHNDVEIFRSIKTPLDKNNNFKRVLRLLSLSFSFFCKSIRHIKKGDQVIVLTNPAFFLLFMPFVRFISKCKYHILVHDVFPENLISLGRINTNSLEYRLLKRLYDNAYSQADSCISIGQDMSVLLKEKTKGRTIISLITNWSDEDQVTPVQKEMTKTFKENKERLSDAVVFQFAGNLGRAQGLDNLLTAIGMIEDANARFMFIGSGAKSQEISSFASTHENTIYLGFIGRDEQNDFLNSCDIGIVTLADGMYGLGVPSKSYNIMATGRPILYIGESDSEIALCIEKYGIGWVVPPKDPVALKKQVEDIIKDRESIVVKGRLAREVAVSVFGKTAVLNHYYQYLLSLSH